MFELHVWGSATEILVFSPECLASALYLKLAIADRSKYQIVPSASSSYYESVFHQFPYLKDTGNDDKIYEGYSQIVKYLKRINSDYDMDRELSQEDQLLNLSLLNFITLKMLPIAYYTYFLNKTNYDKSTVGHFRHCLRFPIQYYAPLKLKDIYMDKCKAIGLSGSGNAQSYATEVAKDKMDNIEKELSLPALGPTHSELQTKKLKDLQKLKETSMNFRCLNLMKEYLEKTNISETLNTEDKEKTYLFGKNLVSSDFLLIALIVSSLNDQLPDQFMNSYLTLKFPNYVALVKPFQNITY